MSEERRWGEAPGGGEVVAGGDFSCAKAGTHHNVQEGSVFGNGAPWLLHLTPEGLLYMHFVRVQGALANLTGRFGISGAAGAHPSLGKQSCLGFSWSLNNGGGFAQQVHLPGPQCTPL